MKLKTFQITERNNSMNVDLPKTWSELTEEQLKYILMLQSSGTMSAIEVRACALKRFAGIEDHDIPDWFAIECSKSLSWLDHPSADVVRLESIDPGYRPVKATLADLPFGEYMTVSNLWQVAMSWCSVDSAEASGIVDDNIHQIADILYKPITWMRIQVPFTEHVINIPKRKPLEFDKTMRQDIIHWMNGWHMMAAEQWPHLFRASGGGGTVSAEGLREQTDLQIQALTGGDVTKLHQVLDIDTWSALSVLETKQKDAIAAKKEAERRENEMRSRKKK